LLPEFAEITLIDIGAAGGLEPRWNQIARNTNYIGFEPDISAHKKLVEKGNSCRNYIVHPFAIWSDSAGISINFSKKPEVSSHFAANMDFLVNFPESNRFERIKVESVMSKTLDSLKIKNPDFIKIDIQGAELNALLGAKETLKNCIGVELEVEFTEMYLGQPLYGDIAKFLVESGFEFYDFLNLCRWDRDSHSGLGQLVFGDALFLKTPETFLEKNPSNQQISTYLGILALYNRFDLIEHIQKGLAQAQNLEYQKFFQASAKLRSQLNRLNFIIRVLNGLIKAIGPNFKLHLIN
jgi:FkbM family methyltransferase